MSEAVRFCGHTNMLLLSDGERPINRLVDVFTETRSSKHSVSKRNAPKESSESAGLIERSNYEVEKQCRALKHRLESPCANRCFLSATKSSRGSFAVLDGCWFVFW
eukprot:1454891-Pyramimonas_sp.AAC.1